MPYSVQPTSKNQDVAFMSEFQTLDEAKAAARDAAKRHGGKFEVLDGNGNVVAVEG